MKILLINEFENCGGTEVQSKREIANLSAHGINVVYLTFDNSIPATKDFCSSRINIHCSLNVFSKFFNKFFINFFVFSKLNHIWKAQSFDFYHLNNVYKCPATVFSFLRKKKGFQTIRDYAAVCFKGTCVLTDQSECLGYKNANCHNCHRNLRLLAKYLYWKQSIVRRKKSISLFACPSQALTDKCNFNGYQVKLLHNPFDFNVVPPEGKTFQDGRLFLYYGEINEKKGIRSLLKAFSLHVTQFPDSKLIFVGKNNLSGVAKQEFTDSLLDSHHFEWLGPKKNHEILEMMSRIYCVVVPSLWLENYPNTVLEPLCCRTLVVGSDRGGIPEMIGDKRLLFDPRDPESIASVLALVERLSLEEYKVITENAFAKVKVMNSLDNYFSNYCAIVREIE